MLLVEYGLWRASLGLAEALGDDVAQVVVDRELGCGYEISVLLAFRLDQHDRRVRRYRVSPLNVDRDLQRERELNTLHAGVEGREIPRGEARCRRTNGEAGRSRVGKGRVLDAPVAVKPRQVRPDGRVLKRADHDDRGAFACDALVQHRQDAVRDADGIGPKAA